MFGYELLREQWVILVLFIAACLIAFTALIYHELWKPRKKKKVGEEEVYETQYLSTWKGIPTSIKITIFLLLIYLVTYSTYAILNPNSW